MHCRRPFLRPAELAAELGLTAGRVYQLIAAGELPATRVGGAIRIPRDAWEEWLSRQSTAALGTIRSAQASRLDRNQDETQEHRAFDRGGRRLSKGIP